MPSTVSSVTSPGFLREINFSALANGFIQKLFGDVKKPSWMKFTISHARAALEMQTIFSLRVEIEPHRQMDVTKGGLSVGPERRRRSFQVPFEIPYSVVEQFRDELPDMFTTWLKQAIRSNAHKFYELDPRIGWRVEKPGDELSRSLLLDPLGPFSRTGERVYKGGELLVEPRCPFCREPHVERSSPLWGGANLMWVHHHCWRGS